MEAALAGSHLSARTAGSERPFCTVPLAVAIGGPAAWVVGTSSGRRWA